MTSTPLNLSTTKIQLKARLRVPFLMTSKKLNSEFVKKFKLSLSSENNLTNYSESKLNKLNIDSFGKYSLKTNLLKKLLLNLSIKELYQEEKECSKRCKEVISEIIPKNAQIELQNLPLIKPQKIFIKKNIKIKKIKFQEEPFKRIIRKKNIFLEHRRNPSLSSANKITTSMESTKEKEMDRNLSTSKLNIILTPKALFNYRHNFSILKRGGIKYNNSIFRYKNMNDLLHF